MIGLEGFLETIREFVREECVPLEQEFVLNSRVPGHIVDRMRALGLFGLSIPVEYGGLGLDPAQEVRVLIELRHASAVCCAALGSMGMGYQPIVLFGTHEQKLEWLPRLARGEFVAALSFGEPNEQVDALSLAATARRDGPDYVLNGTKRFVADPEHAGVFVLKAMAEGGPSVFLVPAGEEGVAIDHRPREEGSVGSSICDVKLKNVRLPERYRLGGEGDGTSITMQTIDRTRLYRACACVGMAERLVDEALSYLRSEKMGGSVQDPAICTLLAENMIETQAARALVLDAVRDDGAGSRIKASAARQFAADVVFAVADRTLRIFGNDAKPSGVHRLCCGVRAFGVDEVTRRVQHLTLVLDLLKDTPEERLQRAT